jgi:large subunit ribosomal protein L13
MMEKKEIKKEKGNAKAAKKEPIYIDANKLIFGRLASFTAKKAIEGNAIEIVNAEKSIITGNKDAILWKVGRGLRIQAKGNPDKAGLSFYKRPDKVLRRAIRGMLPWKSSRGREALHRVVVHLGVPEKLKGKNFEKLEVREHVKRFMELGEACSLLGAKW